MPRFDTNDAAELSLHVYVLDTTEGCDSTANRVTCICMWAKELVDHSLYPTHRELRGEKMIRGDAAVTVPVLLAVRPKSGVLPVQC